MRLLLVEDNELLGSGLRLGLMQHDFTVDWVKDGKAALQALLSQSEHDHFDIVVLDIGLPKLSGLEVIKSIRAKNIKTPILILTAYDTISDRIKGLDSGADDYLCKPFDLGELCARVRSLIRRTGGAGGRATPTINIRNVVLDPSTRRVYKDGAALDLSRREFVLLHLLFENVNRVLSREQIIQNLYGWGDDVDSNALEVHIHNIRKKLGTSFIATVRGVGYMVEDIDKLTEESKK